MPFARRSYPANAATFRKLCQMVFDAIGSDADTRCQSLACQGRFLSQQGQDPCLGSFLGSLLQVTIQVVVKFKVTWLCDLTIRPPLLLPSLAPEFRQSLPE